MRCCSLNLQMESRKDRSISSTYSFQLGPPPTDQRRRRQVGICRHRICQTNIESHEVRFAYLQCEVAEVRDELHKLQHEQRKRDSRQRQNAFGTVQFLHLLIEQATLHVLEDALEGAVQREVEVALGIPGDAQNVSTGRPSATVDTVMDCARSGNYHSTCATNDMQSTLCE